MAWGEENYGGDCSAVQAGQWPGLPKSYTSLRVHVSNNWVLRVLVIVIMVQVLGKYMIIRYLGP